MDTTTMAVRIALLMLVTCLFVGIWSGDRPDEAISANRSNQLNPQKDNDSVRPRSSSPPMTPLTGYSTHSHVAQIPLPKGICAGTYLVADQFGRTMTRIVTANDGQSHATFSNNVGRDHYSVKSNDSCWHYIRISRNTYDRLAAQPSKAIVR